MINDNEIDELVNSNLTAAEWRGKYIVLLSRYNQLAARLGIPSEARGHTSDGSAFSEAPPGGTSTEARMREDKVNTRKEGGIF